MTTIAFLGVRFAACDMAATLAWVEARVGGAGFAYVVTPNVDHIVTLHEDGGEPWRAAYRQAVDAADLVVNDSRVLARLAALSGKRLPLVPGSDLLRNLMPRLAAREGALALVGGNEREAQWLRQALPRWRIAHCDPPMGVREDARAQQAIAEFVEREHAEIVLFAIGAPQSELVAHLLARRGHAGGVGLCIGASVEFLSGAKRRAPAWVQSLGLEWAHRLTSEPQRLWRRYLVKGPRVFALWWAERNQRAG